jgi:hypothetical protein
MDLERAAVRRGAFVQVMLYKVLPTGFEPALPA